MVKVIISLIHAATSGENSRDLGYSVKVLLVDIAGLCSVYSISVIVCLSCVFSWDLA